MPAYQRMARESCIWHPSVNTSSDSPKLFSTSRVRGCSPSACPDFKTAAFESMHSRDLSVRPYRARRRLRKRPDGPLCEWGLVKVAVSGMIDQQLTPTITTSYFSSSPEASNGVNRGKGAPSDGKTRVSRELLADSVKSGIFEGWLREAVDSVYEQPRDVDEFEFNSLQCT